MVELWLGLSPERIHRIVAESLLILRPIMGIFRRVVEVRLQEYFVPAIQIRDRWLIFAGFGRMHPQINIAILLTKQIKQKSCWQFAEFIFLFDIPSPFYKIILLQEEMKSPKGKPVTIESKNAPARCPPIAFRTIMKCRNNSLQPSPEALQATHRSNDSRLSVLSNSSAHIHLPAAKAAKGKPDQDSLSRKSVEVSSKNNIKDMQKSMIATPRDSQVVKTQVMPSFCEQARPPLKQGISLQELQKKIECLLRGKLQRYKLSKKGVGLTNWNYLSNDTIYSQLQGIMADFKAARSPSQQNITEISARVELIERMMASQTIEAELIKQRYHGFNSQRSNISSYHRKPQIDKSPNLNHQKSQIKVQAKPGQMLAAVSNFISTNREAFSKPSKDSYVNTRYKHPAYSPNRQVLPRSCYSTQFLNYGPMPTFDCRQMGLESLPAHTSLAIKTTSYQTQFKERPINVGKSIDYRDLDCCRDKFKNPNISFMNHCKRQMIDASSTLKKTACSKIQPKIVGSKLSKLLSQTTFNDFYKSQQRRNYHGHSGAQTEQLDWIKASPKNSHLLEITASMKQSFLRG